MHTLFDCLATLTDRPLGTVVHLGAGSAAVLTRYAALAPRRVVLVEGDHDTAAELQRRAPSWPGVEVQCLAVAVEGGPLAWHRYNLPALNGPLDATGLSSRYPRLRQTGLASVTAVALTTLLDGLGFSAENPAASADAPLDVLVLDLPGQAAALLAALPDAQLRRFGAVLLRGCRDVLSSVADTAAQSVSVLVQRGYDVLAADHEQEPLWPVTLLHLDPRREADTAPLLQRITALDTSLREREQVLATLQAELTAMRVASAAQQASNEESEGREAALTAQLAQCRAHVAAAEQDAASAAGVHAEHLAQVATLQAELSAMRVAAAAQQEANKEREARTAALTAQLAQCQALGAVAAQEAAAAERVHAEHLAQTEASIQAGDQQAKLAAERQTQIDWLHQQLAEARETATLSVKLQTLREADLKDLQGRYQTALSKQQSQHELLSKLAQRLSAANAYFHQLSQAPGSLPLGLDAASGTETPPTAAVQPAKGRAGRRTPRAP